MVTVMTIRNHIISFIVALVAGGMIPLCAADGSTAYNFLNITSSSRIYGLGGVNISIVDDDINSIDQNPGLLGPEVGKQLGLNYMHYVGDANFAGVRYGMAAGEHGAWAAGIQYFGYGDMKAADVTGNITGTFSAKDMAFSATYSHDITGSLRVEDAHQKAETTRDNPAGKIGDIAKILACEQSGYFPEVDVLL